MSDTTTRVETPYLTLIKRRDPTFFRDRLVVAEYEFTGRAFTADPTARGAYGAYAPITADDFFQDATPDVFAAGSASAGSSPGELDFSDPDQSGLLEVI